MSEKGLRWSGLAVLLGGLLFGVAGSAMNLRPAGVPGGPHRESNDLGLVMLAGGLLIVPGIAALRTLLRGRGRTVGTAALALTVLGFVVSLLSALGSLVGQRIPWPLPISGLLALWTGSVLISVAVLTQGVLSRVLAALLLVASLALFLFNTEDSRALMALPFALAWMATGYQLWSRSRARPASSPSPVGTTDRPGRPTAFMA